MQIIANANAQAEINFLSTLCQQVLVGKDAIMATPAMSALIRRRKLYGMTPLPEISIHAGQIRRGRLRSAKEALLSI